MEVDGDRWCSWWAGSRSKTCDLWIKKELTSLAYDDYDLIYFEPNGDLYVDANGDSKGFGKKSVGGMIADLPNHTILTESDVLIGV